MFRIDSSQAVLQWSVISIQSVVNNFALSTAHCWEACSRTTLWAYYLIASTVVPNLFDYIPPFAHFGTSHSSPTTQTFFHSSPITRVYENLIYGYILSRLPFTCHGELILRVRTLVWITNEKLSTITWSKSGTRTICCQIMALKFVNKNVVIVH